MSNLSNELFFEAHRGISGKPDPQYGLGMHFSKSPDVAKTFAKKDTWQPGTVFHARIPISSVEMDPKVLGQRGYAGFGGKDPLLEQEIPVRQGAPVFVTGHTTIRPQDKNLRRRSRTMRYNEPKEMTA